MASSCVNSMNEDCLRTWDALPPFITDFNTTLFLDTAILATTTSMVAFQQWTSLFFQILLVVLKCLTLMVHALLPHGQSILIWIWKTLKQQSPLTLFKIASVLVLIVVGYRAGYLTKIRNVYLLGKRNILKKYKKIKVSLAEKSKWAAACLPHLLYLIVVLLYTWLVPKTVTAFWATESTLGLLVLFAPLIFSGKLLFTIHPSQCSSPWANAPLTQRPAIYAASNKNNTPGRRKKNANAVAYQAAITSTTTSTNTKSEIAVELYPKMEEWLTYWILWAAIRTCIGLLSFFITDRMAQFFAIPYFFLIVLVVWMLLPYTSGTVLLFDLCGPILHANAHVLSSKIDKQKQENFKAQASIIFTTLTALRIVPEVYITAITDLWSQGPVLLGVFFLFTPGFVTYRGGLLVGLAFPAYRAIGALIARDQRNVEWWLTYFVVLAGCTYLTMGFSSIFAWLPLFYHAQLVGLFWLQFPYFRGANVVWNLFMAIFVKTQTRNKTLEKKNE